MARAAEGVHQLKLPVPFPLRFVSVYLIEGDDGWTMIDAGYDCPECHEAWERGARTLGLDLRRDVARIVVTHFHPDHIGASRWLQERTGAPVCMLEKGIERSRMVWEDRTGPELFAGFLTRHGMGAPLAEKAAAAMRPRISLPEEMLPLYPGEELTLGESAVTVLHAPGHADYQLVFHDEARGLLFAADQVMLGITPNVGLWSESEPHPLARYAKSLNELRGLGTNLVLPGHGPLFHDLDGRISELLSHHAERLEAMHAVLEDGPKTPYEVSRVVFRGTLTVYERGFALAETLAHLEHLALEGRAERTENGTVVYRAT
ncbi:MAG: MBL fold metallo-hydrolase [Actinomycetota bacterium]|nr:MBL fold metallo-hydrolase [Actinomycetota bacterium]